MKDNPFLSSTYTNAWLEHFRTGKTNRSFSIFPDIRFVKNPYFPFYCNVGATLTKGLDYHAGHKDEGIPKGRTFLIYDYPSHLTIDCPKLPGLGFYNIPQYSGYLCNLEQYSHVEGYMAHVLSKSSISKIRRYQRKLEMEHHLETSFIGRESGQEQLEALFVEFKSMLERRFSQKRKYNHNLTASEWAFHRQVSIELILEGKAGLFLLQADGKPIAITLMYFGGNTAIDVMRAFDIDYAKFRPGSVSIKYQIEWCLKNGYSILDFSKGHFEYKQRWSNTLYFFEYHIYFDKRSPVSVAMASGMHIYYHLKRQLREMRLDVLWQRLNFLLGN